MPSLTVRPYDGRIPKGEKLRRVVEDLLTKRPAPADAVIALTDVYTNGLSNAELCASPRNIDAAAHDPTSQIAAPSGAILRYGMGMPAHFARLALLLALVTLPAIAACAGPAPAPAAATVDIAPAAVAVAAPEASESSPVSRPARVAPSRTPTPRGTGPDLDGDGIPDASDRCPDVAEDRDGFQDADGCPEPDNDKDGITDANDQCPNEPETLNGVNDADGCPD